MRTNVYEYAVCIQNPTPWGRINKGPPVSGTARSQIRPWVSLVKTSSKVMKGTMLSSTSVRRFSHSSRPVYWSTKTNHAVGATTIPTYCTLFQKTLVDTSALPTSSAYPNNHSAPASANNTIALLPGTGRRNHT